MVQRPGRLGQRAGAEETGKVCGPILTLMSLCCERRGAGPLEVRASGSEQLGSSSSFAAFFLCHLEEIISPRCASASLTVNNSAYFLGSFETMIQILLTI